MLHYCDLIKAFCDDMDCDNCPCIGYSFNEERFPDEANEIETPAKFQELETLPPKPAKWICDLMELGHSRFKLGGKRCRGQKPKYKDNRSPRIAPIMARQLEQFRDSAPDWRLTAEAYMIEVDFDQACQEQAEYKEEMRLRELNILYYDEIEAGFNEMFARYYEDCHFLIERSA